MFTTSNMQLLYFIEIHVSKADASLSSGLWRPPSIPSLHVYSNVRVNQFLNQCAPALLISFPHTHHFSIFSIIIQYPISSSYHSRSHIILKIMLISFPHTHHFSIFSILNIILISFSYHSQNYAHIISTTCNFSILSSSPTRSQMFNEPHFHSVKSIENKWWFISWSL